MKTNILYYSEKFLKFVALILIWAIAIPIYVLAVPVFFLQSAYKCSKEYESLMDDIVEWIKRD